MSPVAPASSELRPLRRRRGRWRRRRPGPFWNLNLFQNWTGLTMELRIARDITSIHDMPTLELQQHLEGLSAWAPRRGDEQAMRVYWLVRIQFTARRFTSHWRIPELKKNNPSDKRVWVHFRLRLGTSYPIEKVIHMCRFHVRLCIFLDSTDIRQYIMLIYFFIFWAPTHCQLPGHLFQIQWIRRNQSPSQPPLRYPFVQIICQMFANHLSLLFRSGVIEADVLSARASR